MIRSSLRFDVRASVVALRLVVAVTVVLWCRRLGRPHLRVGAVRAIRRGCRNRSAESGGRCSASSSAPSPTAAPLTRTLGSRTRHRVVLIRPVMRGIGGRASRRQRCSARLATCGRSLGRRGVAPRRLIHDRAFQCAGPSLVEFDPPRQRLVAHLQVLYFDAEARGVDDEVVDQFEEQLIASSTGFLGLRLNQDRGKRLGIDEQSCDGTQHQSKRSKPGAIRLEHRGVVGSDPPLARPRNLTPASDGTPRAGSNGLSSGPGIFRAARPRGPESVARCNRRRVDRGSGPGSAP